MKKEIPIAFSTPMVEAIVEKRKTMTRRIVTPQPDRRGILQSRDLSYEDWEGRPIKLPYGNEGDLLWVREEHQIWQKGEYWMCKFRDGHVMIKYVSEISEKVNANLLKRKTLGQWQRGRFLPKEFARIWLERTETVVERLQAITFKDAVSEGIEMVDKEDEGYKIYGLADNITSNTTYAPDSFKSLWESINGEGSWKVDPWVWVVGFKVVECWGLLGKPVD